MVFCLYFYWPDLPEGRGQGSRVGLGVGEVWFVEEDSRLSLRADDQHGGLREALGEMFSSRSLQMSFREPKHL